ncbi:hypothetical protein HQ563_18750 [bacterium]|nr:hypothetical protein [bacterium]
MERVLIVDDDEGARESLRIALRDRYEIVLADSGEEAMELLKKAACGCGLAGHSYAWVGWIRGPQGDSEKA